MQIKAVEVHHLQPGGESSRRFFLPQQGITAADAGPGPVALQHVTGVPAQRAVIDLSVLCRSVFTQFFQSLDYCM